VSEEIKEERTVLQSKVVRLALGLLIVGVIIIVAGVIIYLAYRSSRNKPLEVDVYPGAQQVSSEVLEGFDHQQYQSSDSIEKIEKFYTDQDMDCEQQFQTINGQAQHLDTRCVIDHSFLDISQYTRVIIQPQVDEAGNATGTVIIDVRRYWGG
jgi:hypothetical protein